MPVQTPLAGESLERAKHVLGFSTKLGDGSSLLTPENLERLGFSTTVVDAFPVDEGGAGVEVMGSPGFLLACNLELVFLYDMCLVDFLIYTILASLCIFVNSCVVFTSSIMLASRYVLANNCIVSDDFLLSLVADMASNIPSFVKRSTKYEDLFGEASGS